MPEENGQGTEGQAQETSEGQNAPQNEPQGQQSGTEQDPPGAEHLGDPGKKALDTMKAERKAAQDEAKQVREEYERYKAEVEGKQAEYEQQQRDRKVQEEALSKANERILKAEVRAASTGKLADPADALLYLNLSEFEVGSDGEVNADDIAKAIDSLIQTKPYLAAQGKRFQGSADGGARNGHPEKSIDEEIAEASKARDFQRVIALKQKRAADLAAANK